jgi:Tol biopolymer transport system component
MIKALRISALAALAALVAIVMVAGAWSAGTSGIRSGKLVFSGVDPSDGMSDIYVLNADGNPQVNITHDTQVRKDLSPSWSADGTKIVFARHYATGGSNIMLVNADGSELTKLTGAQPIDASYPRNVDPSLSPDGSQVVFASDVDGNYDLYAVDIDLYSAKPGVPTLIRLTKTEAPVRNFDPSWSPDGKTIVYSRSGDVGKTSRSAADLYLLKPETREVSRLTATTKGLGDRGAVFSPDGAKVAFFSDRAGNNDIYVRNLSARYAQQVTTSVYSDTDPTWGPDNQALTFVSNRTGATEFWALDLLGMTPGPRAVQLTFDKQQKSHPSWAPAGLSPVPASS